MLGFILRRVLWGVPVLLAASVAVFFSVTLAVDPLAELRVRPGISEETLAAVTASKHLDRPLVVQYGFWLRDGLTNHFGTTFFGERPILPELGRALAVTLQLVVAAEVIGLAVALLVGVASASRPYSPFDHTATALSLVTFALPVFWLALLLQLVAVWLYEVTGTHVLYTAGLSSPAAGNVLVDRVQHLALPVTALSVVSIATYSRYVRAAMLDVMSTEYVRTGHAKGLSRRRVVGRHALRNALIPVTTLASVGLGRLLGGAIVVENIFGLHGMGAYLLAALQDGDAYQVMAWLMVTASSTIGFTLVTDIVYGWLDPRIRHV